MAKVIVTEPQVLLATFDWLLDRSILPYNFSISGGPSPEEREEQEELKKEILRRYEAASDKHARRLIPDFSQGGPDIEAISSSELWRIECKGIGKGSPQTQSSKFNDALAGAVSYYTDKTEEIGPDLKERALFLGLALPDTDKYMKELKRRVRNPLRQRLNLWILLFEMETGKIRPISPEEEIQ